MLNHNIYHKNWFSHYFLSLGNWECVQKVSIYHAQNLIDMTDMRKEKNYYSMLVWASLVWWSPYHQAKASQNLCIHVTIWCIKGTQYFVTQGHFLRHSGTFQYCFQATITIARILFSFFQLSLWQSAYVVS